MADCGVVSRIEMFAFIITMALGMSMTPFISQNFGAGRLDGVIGILWVRRILSWAERVCPRFVLLSAGGDTGYYSANTEQ